MKKVDWIYCPICNSKTRNKVREDTVLKNYPLYCPKCKQETLIEVANLKIKVWGDFLCSFFGRFSICTYKVILFIHSTSEKGRKPVKKIPVSSTGLLAMKVEVQSLINRIYISYNRKGHRAFAVFLLSFFIGIHRRIVSGMWCRSPPFQSGFLYFQKFGLEENTVKYAPRKVYIRESGGYAELSYTEFCRRRNANRPIWTSCLSPCRAVCLKS